MTTRSTGLTTVARWELRGAARSRWVLACAVLYATAAVVLTLAGLRSLRSLGITGVGAALDGLLNLGVLLPPLAGLLVGSGAVVGAKERGLLEMMGAQPLQRRSICWGMMFGLTGAVWVAVLVGFGVVAVVLAPSVTWSDLRAVGVVAGATLAAGAIGVSLGLAISSLTRSRSQATAVAAAVWFVAALGVDLLLAGIAPGLRLGPSGVLWAVVANPLQAIRLLAMMVIEAGSLGPFGAYLVHRFGTLGSYLLLGSVVAGWTLIPMLTAVRVLRGRDLQGEGR